LTLNYYLQKSSNKIKAYFIDYQKYLRDSQFPDKIRSFADKKLSISRLFWILKIIELLNLLKH